MASYGWTGYDVRQGGQQIINDTGNSLDLITEFAKPPHRQGSGSWGLRVRGIPRPGAHAEQRTSVVLYIGNEDQTTKLDCKHAAPVTPSDRGAVCDGAISSLGAFLINVSAHTEGEIPSKLSIDSLTVPVDTLWQAKSIFVQQLKKGDAAEEMVADSPGQGSLHFIQQSFEGAFEFDVLFSLKSASENMSSTALTDAITTALSTVATRLESTYPPRPPFQHTAYVEFSKALVSNLLGGIGYFDGSSRVDVSKASAYAETDPDFWEKAALAQTQADIEDRGPYQLYSAVPSRPFFPRGFLWDEGFHLLIVLDWDVDLALEIVSSWFDLMDEDGWIAREQILGPEARSKVPPQFQTQYPHFANPPTLFLVIEAFVSKLCGESPYSGAPSRHLRDPAVGKAFLQTIYPKMKRHYSWFRSTQAGNLTHYQSLGPDLNEGYRWRGRTPQLTLTSGLDDYPRAQPPHPEELHVDALCWVGSMAAALLRTSAFLGEERDQTVFAQQKLDVTKSIDIIHWSDADQAYCDTTIRDGDRVERVCHKGYISLFPFLTGLMGPKHRNLAAVLETVRSPEELWSSFGIRSLSRRDPHYGTGENYWRGPIWVPLNYLILNQLLLLATQSGPQQHRARAIYVELRQNIVGTVFESWKKTGFAWEQYNPETGEGQRTQYFTGWTALAVRIMAMPDLEQLGKGRQQPQLPGITGKIWPASGEDFGMMLLMMLVAVMATCFMFRRIMMRVLSKLLRI